MKSVPKPAYLNIIVPDEPYLARSAPDDFYVFVRIRWREPERVPPIVKRPRLEEMPELPDANDFEVLERSDGRYTLIPETWRTKPFRFGKGPTFFELEQAGKDMGWGKSWAYVEDLIKQFQPDFDYTASEDNAKFLLRTLKHLNEVEDSRIALWNHLEHSGPGKKTAHAWRENPERDVRGAILRDVMGLSSLEIRRMLGPERKWKRPQAHSTAFKREDATARNWAKRGRMLLEHFYGVEEWRCKVARMCTKRAEWLELEDRPKAQMYYLLAEGHGTSVEEEERKALQDGFDELLGAWVAAWERDDQQAAEVIEAMDPRFDIAKRRF